MNKGENYNGSNLYFKEVRAYINNDKLEYYRRTDLNVKAEFVKNKN